MALVPIDSLHRRVMRILENIDAPGGLEILSYKRNRSVALIRMRGGKYQVIERGFTLQECLVEEDALPRVLKAIIKREFPRSRKVRLFKLTTCEELERQRQKI